MSNFKEATRIKLRFNTSQGLIGVEQLWELSMAKLERIVRALKKQLTKDNDDDLSFLDDTSTPVDKTVELSFDIAKEVYLARKEEREAVKNAKAKKENNEKIMALIVEKEEGKLQEKSVEELKAMLIE